MTSSPNVCCSDSSSPEHVSQRGRYAARRGLAFADLVAVDDEHVGAAAASSRATARPAKLAPQIRTSQSRSSGVRSIAALCGSHRASRPMIRTRDVGGYPPDKQCPRLQL